MFTRPLKNSLVTLLLSIAIFLFGLSGEKATTEFNLSLKESTAASNLAYDITKLKDQLNKSQNSQLTPVYTFKNVLRVGSTGADVKQLQKFLNSNGFIVAAKGAGSPGNESAYFGTATSKAIKLFQLKYKIEILTPIGLTKPTGNVGTLTLKKLNALQQAISSTSTPIRVSTINPVTTTTVQLTSLPVPKYVIMSNSLPNQTIEVNKTLSFKVNVTSSVAGTITYKAVSLPSNASFNPVTQEFVWTPTTNQVGQREFIFQATDSSNNTAQISVIINVTTAPEVQTLAPATSKILFNSLIYTNSPTTTANMVIMDTNSEGWFNTNGTVNQTFVQEYANSLKNKGIKYAAIDIESLPIYITISTQAEVTNSINLFTQIVNEMKQTYPDLKVGIYGLPTASYYPLLLYTIGLGYQQGKSIIDVDSARYWGSGGFEEAQKKYFDLQKNNDALVSLYSILDFGLPDLYTHVDISNPANLEEWQIAAIAGIQESRRVMPGKPVYPFLMPQYTPELDTSIASKDLPTQGWLEELKTVWQNADGAVIWGGWDFNGREMFNPDFGWWKVIQNQSYLP